MCKIIRTVILSLFLFNRIYSFGQELENSIPKTIPALKTAIKKVLEETQTPGVGLALVNAEGPIWIAGLGKADIENNISVNQNTMFRIGSVSKMFVSLAILKLQEEGIINLKDKVRDIIPEIEFQNPWANTSPILIEHLLEHTTGWDDWHFNEYVLNKPNLRLKEGLGFHPHSRISRWVPGTRRAYSNSGPNVAAYIVEKITKQSFEDYIEENFFQPMGMENMTYFATDSYNELASILYVNKIPQDYWHLMTRPSGAINASPKDMAKMVRFFINRASVDSLKLISDESLERMETASTTIGDRAGLEVGYGLSNSSSSHKNFIYRTHIGGVHGGLTDFSYLPKLNVGYVIMINSENWEALNQITNLIRDFQVNNTPKTECLVLKTVCQSEIYISGYYTKLNPRFQMVAFLDRILSVQHIWQKSDTIFSQKQLGGEIEKYLCLNENQYISIETGKIAMVKAMDPLEGNILQANGRMFKKSSTATVFGQLIFICLWFFGIISSIILGIIWSIRFLMGKIAGGSTIWIRLWPVVSSLIIVITIVLIIFGTQNFWELLGKRTLISISIQVFTICFALTSFLSVFYLLKIRQPKIKKITYWYSIILTGLHFMATCYFIWFEIIGIRIWN